MLFILIYGFLHTKRNLFVMLCTDCTRCCNTHVACCIYRVNNWKFTLRNQLIHRSSIPKLSFLGLDSTISYWTRFNLPLKVELLNMEYDQFNYIFLCWYTSVYEVQSNWWITGDFPIRHFFKVPLLCCHTILSMIVSLLKALIQVIFVTWSATVIAGSNSSASANLQPFNRSFMRENR